MLDQWKDSFAVSIYEMDSKTLVDIEEYLCYQLYLQFNPVFSEN
jgi:hypothetical protein